MKFLIVFFIFGLIFNSSINALEQNENIFRKRYESGTEIEAVESKFIKNKHVLTQCEKKPLCLIDNKPFWGSDGKIPKTVLEKLVFKKNDVIISLDTSGMFDPGLDSDLNYSISVSHCYGDTFRIHGKFSDGAGAYFAEWLVTKQGSIRVLLGDSELLYESFNTIFKGR